MSVDRSSVDKFMVSSKNAKVLDSPEDRAERWTKRVEDIVQKGKKTERSTMDACCRKIFAD